MSSNLNHFKVSPSVLIMDHCGNAISMAKQILKQDMETEINLRLDSLMADDSPQKDNFYKLITKFISQDGKENISWEDIKKPSSEMVNIINICKV